MRFLLIPRLHKRARMMRGSAVYQARLSPHAFSGTPAFVATPDERAAFDGAAKAMTRPIDPCGRMDAGSLERWQRAMNPDRGS